MSTTNIQSPEISQNHEGASPESRRIALRALEGEGEAIYVPLGALRLDERNVRKDEPTEAEIEELADLLEAQRLLQNLIVVAYAKPIRGKGREKNRVFTHGVIGGGRRLRALLRLVKRGRLTLDEPILCVLIDEDRALAVSAAENSGREPMSAADTIVAFADMVRAGAGVEELAVCFGLSPLTVQRRLKLAGASPALFALFRQGVMTLDQLMALALTDDHAAQEAAWSAAPEYDRSPRRLRALIAGESLSQSVVRFVGVPAYEAAGGRVLRDLFADSDEQPAYIQDRALMMRLATEKLEGIAQGLRDEGLAWVEVFSSWGYQEREQFINPPSTKRAPTEEEAAALAELAEQAHRLYTLIEEAGPDDEDYDEERVERLEQEAAEVAAKKDAIEDARRVVLPEVAALTGAVVYIDHQGRAGIERGLLRKTDAGAVKRAVAKTQGAGEGGAVAAVTADEKGGVSERLCHQLTAHRTRALQACLLGDRRVALAALAHPLLTRLVYGPAGSWSSRSAIRVSAEECEGQLKSWAPDLADCRAEQRVQAALQAARDLLPQEVAELLPWLLEQPVEVLQGLLTLCSALSLNAINGSGKHDTTVALAAAVNLDMADWWEASEASYLGSVPKSLLEQAVKEAGMADEATALGKLKKAEAVKKAEALLAGKRWLPSVLR